jgi:hypothetical protein
MASLNRALTAAIFFGALTTSIAAPAATLPLAGPYQFVGTVAHSSGGSCPYAKGTAVSGYSYFPGATTGVYYNGKTWVEGPTLKGNDWTSIFTPLGLKKIAYTLKYGDASLVSFSGALNIANTSNLGAGSGSNGAYTAKTEDLTGKSFGLLLDVTASDGGCVASYKLTYKRGIPQKFLDLLSVP